MPRVFLPQILWHSKDNKRCDRVYSIDFQPKLNEEAHETSKNTTTLRLATGGADEFVHIWQITIHDHAPQYTHFVNNNQNPENKLEFEQPLSIKILARLVGHIGEVNSVRWSHDGLKLATGGEDRCIFLWVKGSKQNNLNEDTLDGYEEYWTRTHYFRLSNVVNTICWCPEDRVLSVSTEDGHVSLVDTQVEGTGKIRYFEGHTSFAQGVSLDPKNELLASLGSDQCLRVWKRRNQKMWKSVLVLKAARDRGDIVPMNELETNIELRKYSRLVFMSEDLKTFFRRLDWSPDGRLLVAPTGIRHDKNNLNISTNSLNSGDNNLTHNSNEKHTNDTNETNETNGTNGTNNTNSADASTDINHFNTTDENKTNSVNNTNNDNVPETDGTADQKGQVALDKGNQNYQLPGENSIYTLYVFHRKLLNFGIPMLTHQSPTGPFVVVKFCPIYLSIFDKKRQHFYNLLLNANKNKLKPIKRKLDRTSKQHLVTTNKINAYFSSVNSKSSENDVSSNQELMNEEDNEQMDEEYEYENDSGQDEDEVMTILQENTEFVEENMENTATDTPNNLDNTEVTDINLEGYDSPTQHLSSPNSLISTPMSRTVRENTYRGSPYGSYSNYGEDMECIEVSEQLLSTKQNDETNTTLDDYQVDTTNETENNNNNNHHEEFETEESNQMEALVDEEAEDQLDGLGVEVVMERPGFLCENEAYVDSEFNMERMEDEESVKEENGEELEKEELEDVSENEEYVYESVNDGRLVPEVKLDGNEEEVQLEKIDDVPEKQELNYEEVQLEDMDEAEVKVEGVDYVEDEVKEGGEEEVKMEKMEDGLVKEEDKKGYNLRKTRRSVIPLMMESYKQVAKKTKNKVKKEKKIKTEEEPQEEDYDTDLEDELSVPRFLFAAGTTDGSLCFFDTNENSGPIAVLKNLHFCPITDISWSPDGYVCATSSSDGYITFVIFNKRELS